MRRLPVLLLLGSCAFAPPPDGEPFTPPAEYRAIWDSAQACSGLQGDFDEIRFYVVPGDGFECRSGMCAGHYRDGNIYLAEAWTMSAWVVKHEMIHALGIAEHPDVPFKTPCNATWDTFDA